MSLSSADEKTLFRRWGWVYNYIVRKWVAPDGAEVHTDDLMANDTPENEEALAQFIQQHGQLSR